MKIGIDARMLGKGFGLARYVEQLVEGLLEIDTDNEYVLFLTSRNFNIDLKTKARIKKVLADIKWYSLEEQLKFKKIIKKEKIDLMHFPHWNVPLFYNDPFVVTVHDLTMYHYPRPEATTLGPLKFWLKDRAHRLVLRHAVRKAKHILVTSEFTRQDVHKTLKVSLDKMTVTYQVPFRGTWNIEHGTNIFQKHKITKPYVLYVGAAYPHKNLERLLEAWKVFCDKYGNEYRLVFVGKENYFYKKLINNEQLTINNFDYLGFVGDSGLEELYRGAELFVYPSLYEGFGLPPLEAMSRGVPVVSSSASCLPEVLGEGALYFDPKNIEQMSDTIYKGLKDENIRLTLRQNAKHELGKFSWKKSVVDTIDIYKKSIR